MFDEQMATAEKRHRDMLIMGQNMLSNSASPRVVETQRKGSDHLEQNKLVLVNKV